MKDILVLIDTISKSVSGTLGALTFSSLPVILVAAGLFVTNKIIKFIFALLLIAAIVVAAVHFNLIDISKYVDTAATYIPMK